METPQEFIDYINGTIDRKTAIEKSGLSSSTFGLRLKKYGLTNIIKTGRKKGDGGRPIQKRVISHCKECGKEIHHLKRLKRTYCSRECMNKSKDFRDKMRKIDRSYMKSPEYIAKVSNPNTPAYKKYANKVHRLTKHTYNRYKHEINPNDYKRTICGVEGGYQLDHIITIKYGFENNIPEEVLAEKRNLRMLPWRENLNRNWEK